jgi:hypothetical protein
VTSCPFFSARIGQFTIIVNVPQSGKTYRQKITCKIYREQPYVINRREGGVGSLDESVGSAIISGRPFVVAENFRGLVDSQTLESALRGQGVVACRVPYRGEIQASTEHVCWQLSSNQAAATRDLAKRSIITRIKKKPKGYKFKRYPEGDLLQHVAVKQPYYLGCVYAVVKHWFDSGKPQTQECRHDFHEWAGTLDWIIQKVFKMAPLFDDHEEEQERISNPQLNWLRDVAIAALRNNRGDEALKAHEIVDICGSQGVEIPNSKHLMNEDALCMAVGKILGRLFREAETIRVSGFEVRRESGSEYDPNQRREIVRHSYWFSTADVLS